MCKCSYFAQDESKLRTLFKGASKMPLNRVLSLGCSYEIWNLPFIIHCCITNACMQNVAVPLPVKIYPVSKPTTLKAVNFMNTYCQNHSVCRDVGDLVDVNFVPALSVRQKKIHEICKLGDHSCSRRGKLDLTGNGLVVPKSFLSTNIAAICSLCLGFAIKKLSRELS